MISVEISGDCPGLSVDVQVQYKLSAIATLGMA